MSTLFETRQAVRSKRLPQTKQPRGNCYCYISSPASYLVVAVGRTKVEVELASSQLVRLDVARGEVPADGVRLIAGGEGLPTLRRQLPV